MNYSSRFTRLIGQLLDGFIAVIPLVAAAVVAALMEPLGRPLLLAALVWAVGYIFLADGMRGGQSIGKRWLGMTVIDEKTGRPCTFGQSFIRNFILSILGPIDWVFIFGERHQRLGDKLAGTVVVGAR